MPVILALLSSGLFAFAESRRRTLKKKGRGRSAGGANMLSTFSDVLAVLCVLGAISALVYKFMT